MLFLGVWIGLKGSSLNLDVIAKTTPEGKSVLLSLLDTNFFFSSASEEECQTDYLAVIEYRNFDVTVASILFVYEFKLSTAKHWQP